MQAKDKDFIVNISKLTKSVRQSGFGLILIIDTERELDYTLYESLAAISEAVTTESKSYKIASRIFSQKPAPVEVAIVGKNLSADSDGSKLTKLLADVTEKNGDYFFLVCTDNSDKTIKKISEFIDTQEKMYFVTTQSHSIASQVNSENTVIMYHNDTNAYVAEGLASYFTTAVVGGTTGKFKTINGVPAATISTTELSNLHKNNAFSYIEKYGILQTTEGKTTSGEYIDVVMGAYWIKFKMEEGLVYLSVNSPKISYDNQGISKMIAVCNRVLRKAAFEQDIILIDKNEVPQYQVKYVPREDADPNDIANRKYTGISWTAKLSGAIHKATVSGVLEY